MRECATNSTEVPLPVSSLEKGEKNEKKRDNEKKRENEKRREKSRRGVMTEKLNKIKYFKM